MLYSLAIVLFSLGMLMGFLLSLYLRSRAPNPITTAAQRYRALRDRLYALCTAYPNECEQEKNLIRNEMQQLDDLFPRADQRALLHNYLGF